MCSGVASTAGGATERDSGSISAASRNAHCYQAGATRFYGFHSPHFATSGRLSQGVQDESNGTKQSAIHVLFVVKMSRLVILQTLWLQGDSLTLLTRSTTALAPSLPPEAVKELIVPLLCRAADHGTLSVHPTTPSVSCTDYYPNLYSLNNI